MPGGDSPSESPHSARILGMAKKSSNLLPQCPIQRATQGQTATSTRTEYRRSAAPPIGEHRAEGNYSPPVVKDLKCCDCSAA